MSPIVLYTLELIFSCLLVLREMWSYWRKCGTGGEFCFLFLLPARGSGYKLLALEFQLPFLCSATVDSYPSGTTHPNKHFLVQNALFIVIKTNTGVFLVNQEQRWQATLQRPVNLPSSGTGTEDWSLHECTLPLCSIYYIHRPSFPAFSPYICKSSLCLIISFCILLCLSVLSIFIYSSHFYAIFLF